MLPGDVKKALRLAVTPAKAGSKSTKLRVGTLVRSPVKQVMAAVRRG